ncbi:Hsp70 family protein [Micromonospora sp. CPCC 206061]|uniref:Hsp70 family protein n=1 Tax=Micromonospora sp. CPCC 206061 TaxID=3122410 RepID=UPI002FF1AAFC
MSVDLGTFRMGVDFGTSNTVAMLGWPDGRARPVLFDGAPILPSAVFADQSGELLVGRDAVVAALSYPERFEPYPKRRIDDGMLLLGDRAMPIGEAIAAVLRRVVVETQRVAGQWPSQVALTYPAAWGARRRASLLEGAARAGITHPQLIPEPLAAAHHFANLLGDRLPAGGHLLVYDFGAGTFDASVVRRTGEGFAVLASEGLADTGGLDIDAAVVAHLGAVYGGRYPQAWQRLLQPTSPADRRHSRQLWDGVRAAKELLSRTSSAVVHLPLLEQDAPLTREQLDELARPIVDRTVTAARSALLDAGADLRQLAGVVLVGGASRMPIVATQLHRVLGIAATALEQPELVVAEGSLLAAAPTRASEAVPVLEKVAPPAAASPPTRPLSPAPGNSESPTAVMQAVRAVGPLAEAAPPPAGRRRAVLAVVAGVATLIVLVGAGLFATKLVPLPFRDRDNGSLEAGDGDGSFQTPSPGASGALVGALPSGAAPSGGVPSGGTSASAGTSPRPAGSGSTRPRTTPAKPSGGGIKGTPLARYRNSDPPLECEGIGIPLTNSAKSGTLPEVPLSACTGGPTVKSSGGWSVTWFVDYENYYYKSRFVVELYECGGGLVKKVDTGVVEKTGEIDHDVNMNTSGISGQHYTKTRLVSLHLRLDGVVWTNTSNPVVTTACTSI